MEKQYIMLPMEDKKLKSRSADGDEQVFLTQDQAGCVILINL